MPQFLAGRHGSGVIRYPRIIGSVWIALGLLLAAIALTGAIEVIRQGVDWSRARDGPLLLFLLSWSAAAVLGGALLQRQRTSGEIWIGAISATAVARIAARLLRDPSVVYFEPLLAGTLTLVLAFAFYCLTSVALSGWRKYTGQSAATWPGVEWKIVLVSLIVFLGVLFTRH